MVILKEAMDREHVDGNSMLGDRTRSLKVLAYAHLPTNTDEMSNRRQDESALNLHRLFADAHLPTRLSSFVAILVVNLINTCLAIRSDREID